MIVKKEMTCDVWQVDIVLIGFRSGTCTDEDGNKYEDEGVFIGPGIGATHYKGTETREVYGMIPESRAALAVVGAGEASTISGGKTGWGLGGALQVGIRSLKAR